MKKLVYTFGLLLATSSLAEAQTLIKQAGPEMTDFSILEDGLVLYTKKEPQGQFIYAEKRGETSPAKKVTTLNAGTINAVIGQSKDASELYVYHKNGRNEEVISFYAIKEGKYVKKGQRELPKLKNHSYNLGLFLSEDKNTLLISAELGKSHGYDDLYISKWNNGKWTKPKNLSGSVNTKEHEFAPYMAGDSIFFSRGSIDAAYVFGVPFGANGSIGEPVKLASPANATNGFNAYFKKQPGHTTWIHSKGGKDATHMAYVLESKPFVVVPPVVEEEPIKAEHEQITLAKEPVKEAATPAKDKVVVAPALILYNGFNQIHLGSGELAKLSKYLRSQPVGSTFIVKGYSDGYGKTAAKASVSRSRAVSVQKYINRNFPNKRFKIELESEILEHKGKAYRKTEIFPGK